MKIETQNTEFKLSDATSVDVNETDLFQQSEPAVDETARLREELAAQSDARLRLAAEYENYRRRTKKQMAQAAEAGRRGLLERLISLADDLDLALVSAGASTDAVAEGLRLIHRRFQALLEANNVVPFASKGQKFDPERHEAFDVVSGPENEPGTVLTEIRRGYFWNDKLLRPALVVVAQ